MTEIILLSSSRAFLLSNPTFLLPAQLFSCLPIWRIVRLLRKKLQNATNYALKQLVHNTYTFAAQHQYTYALTMYLIIPTSYLFRRETINRFSLCDCSERYSRCCSSFSLAVSSLVQLGVEQLMEILEIWRQLEAVW